jgi:hypothetical protein
MNNGHRKYGIKYTKNLSMGAVAGRRRARCQVGLRRGSDGRNWWWEEGSTPGPGRGRRRRDESKHTHVLGERREGEGKR